MKNRRDTEVFILKWIEKLTESKKNIELYQKMFKRLSDEEFDLLMQELKDGSRILEIIVPPDTRNSDVNISVRKNYKLAEALGYSFEQKIKEGPVKDLPVTVTPKEYMILDLPFRRTKQTLAKGITVAKDVKDIDTITGQVKGDSAPNKLTYPEIQLLVSYGLDESIVELLKDRGGDISSLRALIDTLKSRGKATREQLDIYSSETGSTRSLKNYFIAMHIDNNI